jgi:hypothetical protein
VDGTGSEFGPVAGFGIRSVVPLGSAAIVTLSKHHASQRFRSIYNVNPD